MPTHFIIKTGIAFCCLYIIMGAFGAHALDDVLLDQRSIFKTGNEYHAFHSISLIVLGILSKVFNLDLRCAAIFFVFGILLFSGSLYMISIFKFSFLGFLTPIGGALFIIGWVILFLKSYK